MRFQIPAKKQGFILCALVEGTKYFYKGNKKLSINPVEAKIYSRKKNAVEQAVEFKFITKKQFIVVPSI